MYNENENNDLGRMNPEEHKEEPITTNFTMRDADTEESSDSAGFERRENPASAEDNSGNQMYSRSDHDA
mgnify:CR=1 FL=1